MRALCPGPFISLVDDAVGGLWDYVYFHFCGISIDFSVTFILTCFTPFFFKPSYQLHQDLLFFHKPWKQKPPPHFCGQCGPHGRSWGKALVCIWLVLSLGSYTEAGFNSSKWGHCERVFGLSFPSSASQPHEANRLPLPRVPANCRLENYRSRDCALNHNPN